MLKHEFEQIEETLARAIQNIIGSSKEEFIEDTIVGSDINQIRHLFYYLKSEFRSIFILYDTENYKGRVESVTNTSVTILVPGFEEAAQRRCNIKFEVNSVLYQFEVLILEIARDRITIKIPYFIQSATRRKFKRIPTDELFLKFITLYQPFFDSHADTQIVESRYKHIMEELKSDDPDIHLILRIINDEIRKISPEYEIRFYNGDTPRGIMEETLVQENKTIYLQDVNRVENYYSLKILYGLINYHKSYLALLRRSTEEEAEKFFEKIRLEDLRHFRKNYVCAPLSIFDRVVGHIWLYSTLLDNNHISPDQAHHVDLMARLLSYAMSKKTVAGSMWAHPITKVVNVSLGGILFEVKNKVLFDHLIFHDLLKIELQISHNILSFNAEITRYFPFIEGYNIGANFITSNPDDFRILEHFIFEQRKKLAV